MKVGDLVKTELWGPGVIIRMVRRESVEVLVSRTAENKRGFPVRNEPKIRRIHQRHLEVINNGSR